MGFVASRTLEWPIVVLWFFRLLLLRACVSMTHKLSSACAELILSYHLLSQQICFTQLVPVTSLLFFCVVFCFLCGLFSVVFVFCVVLFLLLVPFVSVFDLMT